MGCACGTRRVRACDRRGHCEVARVEQLRLDQGTGKVEDYLAARSQELQGETAYWRALYELQGAEDELELVTAKRTGESR